MIKNESLALIQSYINGWKQNNIQLIASCLSENCIVIESHGPTYHGIQDISTWFKLWTEAKSTISKWDIQSFTFCEQEQTAFCEWDFACRSNNTRYAFPGISILKFTNHKISFIHEYRMTAPAFDWDRAKLISE